MLDYLQTPVHVRYNLFLFPWETLELGGFLIIIEKDFSLSLIQIILILDWNLYCSGNAS